MYVQCSTELLADAFENFPNMLIEIYEIYFFAAPGLA